MIEQYHVLGSGLLSGTAKPESCRCVGAQGLQSDGVAQFIIDDSLEYHLEHTRLSTWFLLAVELFFPLTCV